jgi:putative serine protease PepD
MKGLEDMPRNRIAAAIAAAALAGGAAGAGIVALADGGSATTAATQRAGGTTPATATSVSSTLLTVGQVAKSATKSVVEIDATSSGSSSSSPFPFGQGGGSSSSEGTGFVYDAKGDILTNDHVVKGASALRVKFSDGSVVKATVVGEDESSDIAVIRVSAPASKLVPLAFGDSSNVEVGDGVVAIGNPFGLDGTVTSGIVSAVGRDISAPDDTPISGAIQTDAAINHGNSGGPLLDLHGDVIGITAQIQSEGGGNDGVGFAIPSNTVKSIAAQLIGSGKAQHALLGVTPENATGGVGIATVQSGSAASDAGLKARDVITRVDGRTVTAPEELRAIIAAHKPGDELTITVRRSGATKTVHATLGSRS